MLLLKHTAGAVLVAVTADFLEVLPLVAAKVLARQALHASGVDQRGCAAEPYFPELLMGQGVPGEEEERNLGHAKGRGTSCCCADRGDGAVSTGVQLCESALRGCSP